MPTLDQPAPRPPFDLFDQGLQADVATLLGLRRVLKGLGSAGLAAGLFTLVEAGPYPGDGSNGPDVLSQSGIVRKDITTSFGTSTTRATGVPLTIRLALQDLGASCGPLAGGAVYVWHCDQGRQLLALPVTAGARTRRRSRGRGR